MGTLKIAVLQGIEIQILEFRFVVALSNNFIEEFPIETQPFYVTIASDGIVWYGDIRKREKKQILELKQTPTLLFKGEKL